jgi:hypothetical protein
MSYCLRLAHDVTGLADGGFAFIVAGAELSEALAG